MFTLQGINEFYKSIRTILGNDQLDALFLNVFILRLL
jgi:hypothetical protein